MIQLFPNEPLDAAKPIVWVLGNHEFYGWDYRLAKKAYRDVVAQFPNVHLLDGDGVILSGVRFIGMTLWSALAGRLALNEYSARIADYHLIWDGERPLRPETTRQWYHDAVQQLRRSLATSVDGPTVVVTHHAPSFRSQHPKWAGSPLHGAFCSNLEDLIGEYQPTYWIHGHLHEPVDYWVGRTRIVSQPYGYPHEHTATDGIRLGQIEIDVPPHA